MTTPAGATGAAAAATGVELARLIDRLEALLIGLYARAEAELLAKLAEAARRGLTDATATAQAAMFGQMRAAARQTALALRVQAGPLARQLAHIAAAEGEQAAVKQLDDLAKARPSLLPAYTTPAGGSTGNAIAAANAIQSELVQQLAAVEQGILRTADDAYRAAVAEAATRLVLGREGLTPQTAQSAAWRELTAQGIHGFVDRSGRRWNLSTYVEMAVRTATQRAYFAAHLATMQAAGIGFFTVPGDGHPCPLCRPWEGAVLVADGPTGIVTAEHEVTGEPVAFHVNGTIAEARAAGLFHPNCRHVLTAYLPGVTKTVRPKAWSKADQRRYDATQRLRGLERRVRASKREQAAALTDLDAQRAKRKVRDAQARIRAHLAQNPDLVRKPQREQLTLGHK